MNRRKFFFTLPALPALLKAAPRAQTTLDTLLAKVLKARYGATHFVWHRIPEKLRKAALGLRP